MSQRTWLACASLAVISASLACAPARAQPTSQKPAESSNLEEVVVTARRVEENQQTVPVAVTNISGDAIAKRNVQQVADLQFSVPNLQIKQSNVYPSLPEFIIRGQRQTLFTDENVVTYVNGVPQSTRGLTLYDMASVQVLKGPQGTLFGKNSNGGAMVFTTKKPDSEYDGNLELEVGNYNLKKATGMVNIPIVTDQVALRIAGQVERRDGVFKNSYPGGHDAGDRKNESGRIELLLRPVDRLESLTTVDGMHRDEIPTPAEIQAAPTNNSGFAALVGLITQQEVIQQSALGGGVPTLENGLLVRQGNPYRISMPTGLGTTVPSGHYNPVATLASKSDVWGIGNNSSYELNDQLTVRNIIGYRYERALDDINPDGGTGFTVNVAPFLTALGAPGLPSNFPGQMVNNNVNYLNKYKTFTEEVQLVGNYEHTKFIVGGYLSHQDYLYAVNSSFTVGPADLYQVGPRYGEDRITTKTDAVFAQGTYDFGAFGLDKLSLTVGIRYNWVKKEFRASNFYTNGDQSVTHDFTGVNQFCNEINGAGANGTGVNTPTQCYMFGARTYRAPTWTVSLDYKFDPYTMIYFTNRRGFKAGSSNPTTVNHDFAMYGSERLTDFEVGLKNQGRIATVPYRFNISAFYGKYTDIQTGDILTFCATSVCTGTYTDLVIFNVGKATIKGIEIEAAAKPVPSLEFNLGYSYQIAKYGDGSVIPQPTNPAAPVGPSNPIDYQTGQNLSGLDFPGVPRHNLTVAATYNLDFIPSSFANTSLSMNYAWRSSTVSNGAIGVFGTRSYGTANMRLTFDDLLESKFSLAFWMSNITNKAYPLSCSDNRASLSFAACYWGEPRTFGVTGKARFR